MSQVYDFMKFYFLFGKFSILWTPVLDMHNNIYRYETLYNKVLCGNFVFVKNRWAINIGKNTSYIKWD